MTKKTLTLFFCCSLFLLHAQEKVLEIQNDLKKSSKKIQSAFSVVDDKTGNFAMFLNETQKTYGFLYSPEKELINKFASEGLPKRYNDVIGHVVDGKRIRLFLKDRQNKTFGSILFDFEEGTTEERLYNFELRNEVYVEGYSLENAFYLITVTKESNTLGLYVFEGGNKPVRKSIDLSKEKFYAENGDRKSVGSLIIEPPNAIGGSSTVAIGKVDSNSPNSVEVTSKLAKMYPKDSGFLLTLDHNATYTTIIDLRIPAMTCEVFKVRKPAVLNYNGIRPHSNSFILDDKIYQISATSREMRFSIKELGSGEELKQIHLTKDQEITFKNTPIIQEGGVYEKYREMEKTAKFLRRIGREDIGLSILEQDGRYVVTMGSNFEIRSTGAPMRLPGFSAVPIAGVGTVTVPFNPTFFAYGNYQSTKATRIQCLFDEDFEHLEGDVPLNVFDKIDDFKSLDSVPAETVFKMDGNHYWGYYSKNQNKYFLFRI